MPSKIEEDAAAATPPAARPLSEQINIATRSVHTRLNKSIIYRLPLALPPKATDASQYVTGMLHIAPVYIAFESLWQQILDAPPAPDEADNNNEPDSWSSSSSSSTTDSTATPHMCTACDDTAAPPTPSLHHASQASTSVDAPHSPSACPRMHSLLAHLRLPVLARADALRADLRQLTGWSTATLDARLADTVASAPVLSNFLRHTRRAVRAGPHVLIAYAWVLYMALFSGGRFIRGALESVDEGEASFWVPASAKNTEHTNEASNGQQQEGEKQETPFRFLRFDTAVDGEDVKLAFKSRLRASEALLTPQEQDDVVQEARCIFDFMVRTVGELDEVCGTCANSPCEEDDDVSELGGMGAGGAGLLSLRSRDSVVVEKERERRKIALLAGKEAMRAAARKARSVKEELERNGEAVEEGPAPSVRFL
ncbi:hypothetical protein F4780DRAFT_763686 [Xylariomycetidae sp. FL0641]|nr:hypothetical protein F4780DRAFT_763686 [Xylariomycetidae sp. FL0641]